MNFGEAETQIVEFSPGLAQLGILQASREYRAKSRNTGCQMISPRSSLPSQTVFIRHKRLYSGHIQGRR